LSKTVTGRVQDVHDKESNDWFGIKIKGDYYNGDDSLTQDVKGFKLEIEYEDQDNWNKIQKINVLEEDSQDAQRREASNAGTGGESNSGPKTSSTTTSMSERQASIQANSMTKTAAEIVAEHKEVDEGEFIEEVSKVAHGLNNISSDIREENLE